MTNTHVWLGKDVEDHTYDAVWSGAVGVDDHAFRAEMAIPWKTIADAGLEKGRLIIDLRRRGVLDGAPVFGQYFEPLKLMSEDSAPVHYYTVRLHFAELDPVAPGQRVFDVALQDKIVLQDFDVVKEAGAMNRAVVREFRDIPAHKALRLEMFSKTGIPSRRTAPIISGIEIAIQNDR